MPQVDACYITTKTSNGYVVKTILMFVCYKCKEQYCLVDEDTKVGMCTCKQSWDTEELHRPDRDRDYDDGYGTEPTDLETNEAATDMIKEAPAHFEGSAQHE